MAMKLRRSPLKVPQPTMHARPTNVAAWSSRAAPFAEVMHSITNAAKRQRFPLVLLCSQIDASIRTITPIDILYYQHLSDLPNHFQSIVQLRQDTAQLLQLQTTITGLR